MSLRDASFSFGSAASCHTCQRPADGGVFNETICLDCFSAWLDRQVDVLANARRRKANLASKEG